MLDIVYDPRMDRVRNDKLISLSKVADFFDTAVRTESMCVRLVSTESMSFLKSVHSPKFVDEVLRGDRPNGYGRKDLATTSHSIAMCGVMTQAAVLAATNSICVCAPVQGFHHAGYENCWGYCTFNGLMTAAEAVIKLGKKVLIIDCDGHIGDGTNDILSRNLPQLAGVEHHSFELDNYSHDAMEKAIRRSDADVVLYQAGADSHIADPYSVGYLTTEEMAKRDYTLFRACRDTCKGVAWNLAGGYGDKEAVLKLHLQTLSVSAEVYGR